ncbi:ParB/RepB/Spo0J family partition protein (plasmid) [Streptomyces avidinii]|uniref:ParB/RepB/Spo0J family partition protein n=1 Tax=Streptomyces avidinii TaxID=1895 RepID=UPI002F911DA1|nr:ParB/RepB/Spo0J family partition protein [Streptomyces avidinii]
MSKKDLLGGGSSFSAARRTGERSERGRAKAIAEGAIPTYELIRIELEEVSPTPLNPRRNFGSDDDLTRFGEELRQAQLAACVVVSRTAYLALWPEHEPHIGPAEFVLVNGERRYRSARHVGIDKLDFVMRDDLARTREDFVDHLLAENLDREDFDVIERARGVQELVNVCAEAGERGAQSRAAERLKRDRSWVTNQLALLTLPTELQTMLSAGTVSERDGRTLARVLRDSPGLSAPQLLEHLEAQKAQAAEVKAQERALLESVRRSQTAPPTAPVSLLSADNKLTGEAPATAPLAPPAAPPDGLLSADNKPHSENNLSQEPHTSASATSTLLSADNNPEPVAAAPDPDRPSVQDAGQAQLLTASKAIPTQHGAPRDEESLWQDPQAVFELLTKHMSPDDLVQLTLKLLDHSKA